MVTCNAREDREKNREDISTVHLQLVLCENLQWKFQNIKLLEMEQQDSYGLYGLEGKFWSISASRKCKKSCFLSS